MTIHIEELENMDFSDVAEGGKLHPIHPGEILREEFLMPLKSLLMHFLWHCKFRPPVSTISYGSVVQLLPTPPSDWRGILVIPLNSGWVFKSITI